MQLFLSDFILYYLYKMPYYQPKKNNADQIHDILFIHIPKTGGTTLEQYLKKKYIQTLYSFKNSQMLPEDNLKNISLQHQTYNTINKYKDVLKVKFDDKLKIITIVRNPYDRIISDLFFYKLIEKNTSPEDVYIIIKKYIDKDILYDNHNIPQYKFIIDNNEKLLSNIHIFRTENLTKELHEYGFVDYNGKNCSTNYDSYLNNDSIKLINRIYHKDFILLKYKKKQCIKI